MEPRPTNVDVKSVQRTKIKASQSDGRREWAALTQQQKLSCERIPLFGARAFIWGLSSAIRPDESFGATLNTRALQRVLNVALRCLAPARSAACIPNVSHAPCLESSEQTRYQPVCRRCRVELEPHHIRAVQLPTTWVVGISPQQIRTNARQGTVTPGRSTSRTPKIQCLVVFSFIAAHAN